MTKTIHITIDEQLLDNVDQAVRELSTTRSAFICEELRRSLHSFQIRRLEEQHAAGYCRFPVKPGEFDW